MLLGQATHLINALLSTAVTCNLDIFRPINQQISARMLFLPVWKSVVFFTVFCPVKASLCKELLSVRVYRTRLWCELVSLQWQIVNNLLSGLLVFVFSYVVVSWPILHIFLQYACWKGCCFNVEWQQFPLPNIHPTVWVLCRKRQYVETWWLQLPLCKRW